jgi:hypothetical protein
MCLSKFINPLLLDENKNPRRTDEDSRGAFITPEWDSPASYAAWVKSWSKSCAKIVTDDQQQTRFLSKKTGLFKTDFEIHFGLWQSVQDASKRPA